MELIDFGLRIVVAFSLGAVVGIERQWRQRMAGLRTNALVAGGASIFVALSAMFLDEVSPTRIAAQVVSGVGFLGAGVIFKEGLNVRGLNTAATLWCSAAIGSLVGAGFIIHGLIASVAVLGAHVGLRPVGKMINTKSFVREDIETLYLCKIVMNAKDELDVRSLLLSETSNDKIRLQSMTTSDLDSTEKMELEAIFLTSARNDNLVEKAINKVCLIPGVTSVSWEIIAEQEV